MAPAARGSGRLDAGLVAACVAASVIALLLPAPSQEGLAAALRNRVLRPLVALERRAAAVRAALVARDDLLRDRGGRLAEGLDTRSVAAENAALRELVGLSARLRRGFVAADLLPTPGSTDPFTIRLGVGRSAGIVPYSAVVTADGLVGMVVSADAETSLAISWAHPQFRVSAMSTDESAIGIVQPHASDGAGRWLLELRGVPFRARLDTGAVIVSTGLGATYPRGIPVGTVVAELVTTEKWARTYLIRPAVLGGVVGPVLVLPPAPVSGNLSGVWTSVTAADSAVRAIVAAGDSLARRAALAELAARRTLMDSLLADSLAREATPGADGAPPPLRPDSVRRVRPSGDTGAVRPAVLPRIDTLRRQP